MWTSVKMETTVEIATVPFTLQLPKWQTKQTNRSAVPGHGNTTDSKVVRKIYICSADLSEDLR